MARKTGSHSDITGPRVREAALTLIARHGFAAVSMRQIAAEVGVQAGALYNYTQDKQTLLFDLLKTHMDELLAAARGEDFAGPPEDALEHFVRFHVHHHIARPKQVFISYMELRNLNAENFAIIGALRAEYEALLEDILGRGQASGTFEVADARLTTFAVIAMLTGVTNWYRDDGRLTPAQIADQYWDIVRRAVGA